MLILIRMELLKLRSTRWPMILAGVALLATMLLALQPLLKAGHGAPSLGTIGATLRVLDAMTRGALVALMIGALVVTSEFRHWTITASLLQVPERAKLVTAKAQPRFWSALRSGSHASRSCCFWARSAARCNRSWSMVTLLCGRPGTF